MSMYSSFCTVYDIIFLYYYVDRSDSHASAYLHLHSMSVCRMMIPGSDWRKGGAGAYNLTVEKFVADPAAAVVCNFSPPAVAFPCRSLPPITICGVRGEFLALLKFRDPPVRCAVILAPSHSTR